jgi:ribonucleoside-diphosphate reductase alpha chain
MPFRRNLCCQVIAPTGSIARLAGCSFGIEPHFFAEYTSNIVGGSFRERHPLADHEAFVTAEEVTPEEHIRMQAAFQGFVDQAVSKTCNLPADATRDDIDRIYRLAWDLGCKGTTVYREGCKDKGVIERVDDCANGKCSL